VRKKITTALLALAIFPLLITTVLLVLMGESAQKKKAKEYHQSVSEAASINMEHFLNAARTELLGMGWMLTRRDEPSARRMAFAKNWLKHTKWVHHAGLYSGSGNKALFFKAPAAKFTGEPPAKLPEKLLIEALKEGVAFGKVKIVPGVRSSMVMLVAVHLKGRKKPYGFLWTDLDLSSLCKEIGNLSARRFSGDRKALFLMTKSLHVFAHDNVKNIGKKMLPWLKSKEVSFKGSASYSVQTFFGMHKGQKHMVVFKTIDDLHWAVVSLEPYSSVMAAITRTWQIALLVGVFCALLAIFLGLWSGKQLSTPVLRVAEAARKVAQGDFGTRVSISSKDEVGEMADAFNKMAQDLGDYEMKLVEETQIRADLGRYLSAELVESIVAREAEMELGGERRTVTVLFADVVGFTPLTESHSPEHIVAILNELFTFLTEIVFRHGGTIDKFMGDCVMAVFGAPYTHEDDALRAVSAAEEMMQWLEIGNAKWKNDLGAELEMGIGINTGIAVAGNIGSEKRMEYTVIGDTINIAARLEGLARPGQILMTRETMEAVEEEFDCESLGFFPITGHKEEIEIFVLDE